MKDRVGGALGLHVERTCHPQHGGVEFLTVTSGHTGHVFDLLERPGAVEPETSGAAEEFWSIGHHEDRLNAYSEPSDLPATFLRRTHSKNGFRALRSDWITFVRAVKVRRCKDDLDSASGLVGDFVGGILDKFKKLAIAISALSDAALSIGMFGYESGVYGVSLQDAGRLLNDGLNNRRERR
ncbi:hypothetical protein AB0L59_00665 [Streptomyces sp. NPDC052109]|uniref:hypothetical protein n=1 Tax=Streptomyces sp. NPDC052109 TaxID=3155527 RepID=UPI0034147DBA